MWRAFPGLLFLLLCVLLFWALEDKNVPVPLKDRLLDHSSPVLDIVRVEGDAALVDFSKAPLSKPVFISFFASWCAPCAAEHSFLVELSKQHSLTMIGIVFSDTAENIKKMLKEKGNPYDYIGIDNDSKTSVAFGLKGVPESFFIDRDGTVRYAHRGVLTEDDIANDVIPLIEQYAK